ncbi:glucokinase [Falsiroseomonas sp. HW251]|uniref:glucokinase n=1 Tax=Falsiroseomonas sp. HW251 TaxID=3390998 RepID=UPI003D31C8A7
MPALLADIGGTNARFARHDAGATCAPVTLPVANHATVEHAIEAALAALGPCDSAVLALAGPVTKEPVQLTNAPWSVSSAALAARFGFGRVRLVNDFLVQAHALPHLRPADLFPIGGGIPDPDAPMIVLGAGTGLGVAGFIPGAGIAIPAEGGHASLAPTDEREDAVVAGLRRLCGRAGVEEALSGRGLVNLHTVLAGLRGIAVPPRDAASIVAARDCPVAVEAVDLFLGLLASFAGDMALAWGARGGVFLSGGVLPRLMDRLEPLSFRTRFDDKAPMQDWMRGIPLSIVTHPSPAFLGLAALA